MSGSQPDMCCGCVAQSPIAARRSEAMGGWSAGAMFAEWTARKLGYASHRCLLRGTELMLAAGKPLQAEPWRRSHGREGGQYCQCRARLRCHSRSPTSRAGRCTSVSVPVAGTTMAMTCQAQADFSLNCSRLSIRFKSTPQPKLCSVLQLAQ